MNNNFLTKRLNLRKIKKEDVSLLYEWSNDNSTYGDYLSPTPLSKKEYLEKFQSDYFWNDKSKTYLIELKENPEPIGLMHYWIKPEDNKVAMVALKIASAKNRSVGYGTEAQKGLVKELFEKYKFDSIEMLTDINNIAQQRCLKKLDFENIETKQYKDVEVQRQGFVFSLSLKKYKNSGVYIFYYE